MSRHYSSSRSRRSTDHLRWLWIIFGVLFLAAGIICFINPKNTFAGIADILGALFFVVGIWWTIRAFLDRDVNPLWWLGLIAGILMLILAFWTSGQFFIHKAYTLLVFAGIWALMSGVIDIVRAFQVRGCATSEAPTHRPLAGLAYARARVRCLLLHPHPDLGGNQHNNVISALSRPRRCGALRLHLVRPLGRDGTGPRTSREQDRVARRLLVRRRRRVARRRPERPRLVPHRTGAGDGRSRHRRRPAPKHVLAAERDGFFSRFA